MLMKLPRIRPKIMGIPVSIETAKGLTIASRDIFLRKFVPDDIKQIRLDICKECPSWSERFNRCTECGCQMRIKAALSSSQCPLKKWGMHLDSGDARIDITEHEESPE